eukprot:TRINITY_DN34427_c0_g1_i1.p1 TRINITY_DN34427_c0_g1~~TRINITY_DN34427_c0_g1_i1.p1  ORF type:complete len:169 (+),score=32.99 TRINITY_DN34427_c0_g1_i1:49-555(+)
MEAVWPAVLKALQSRGLEFEDVQFAEQKDREDILREIFPKAPLYRAHANTVWIKLSKLLAAPQQQASPMGVRSVSGSASPERQQQNISSLDVWTAFLSSLSCNDLTFTDVQYATVEDRNALLMEVFPSSPLWRAQALSFWEKLSQATPQATSEGSPLNAQLLSRIGDL